MNKKILKFLIVIGFASILITFYSLGFDQYLNLTYLKSQQTAFQDLYQQNPALWLMSYFVVYVITTAASLPGATILTLGAGALFGFWTGLALVSFASTFGATLAFLSARFLLRDSVQSKFGDKIRVLNEGVVRDGPFYLLTLRLVPAFPFFLINLLMGLTPISTFNYYIVSQIGMFPGTAVYVNAGTQLARIESLKGILSPSLLASFALLGAFPLIVRKTTQFIKAKRHGQK